MKDFTIVRRGFDTTEVDTYIVDLENEMKKKDRVIEEYRNRESTINRAIIGAQETADSILAQARAEAAGIRAEASAELTDLRKAALALRKNLSEFQESYNRLLRRYLYTGHCEDMTQIFDRLEKVLQETGADTDSLAPLPDVQRAPQDDAMTRRIGDLSQTAARLTSETDARFNLDDIADA